MDELFAYALLLCEGFDVEEEYDKKLDELFLRNPENDDYLELEALGSDIKKSVFYIISHINQPRINREIFGKELVRLLRIEYNRMNFKEFAKHTYLLWKRFPVSIADEEPFESLAYADEPISWGDVEQSKALYEKILSFYD